MIQMTKYIFYNYDKPYYTKETKYFEFSLHKVKIIIIITPILCTWMNPHGLECDLHISIAFSTLTLSI